MKRRTFLSWLGASPLVAQADVSARAIHGAKPGPLPPLEPHGYTPHNLDNPQLRAMGIEFKRDVENQFMQSYGQRAYQP